MAYTRTVLARADKASDIEVHVSGLETEDGNLFIDIREYVVSLDQYGRGITVPSRMLSTLKDGLNAFSTHEDE